MLRFSAPTLSYKTQQQDALKRNNKMRSSATTNCLISVILFMTIYLELESEVKLITLEEFLDWVPDGYG
ncbi:MAG: hypothetical protein ACRCU2_31015, partial [Planktothrix sp.]